jgi:hypothetical protein
MGVLDVYVKIELSRATPGTSAIIYIKKNICLSVLYAFRHRTSKCNQTLQGILFHPEEGQRLLFTEEKIDPPPAKGWTMYLTNEIAAFGSIGEILNSTP